MSISSDEKFMQIAISYAKRGIGRTHPNPSVGCVLVKDNKILAAACTADKGRPHAETIAISKAGKDSAGATAYVTLEPCAHTGKTPPCAKSLIDAKISRVVIANQDPFSKVNGEGISMLKGAGIAVSTGVCEKEAYEINKGFFSTQIRKRPWVTVKVATTLDGKIATSSGESKWITTKESRSYGHLLRAQNDGIMVGYNTVLRDNPSLTCRIVGLDNANPTRIVIDYDNSLDKSLEIFQNQDKAETWVITKNSLSGPNFNNVIPEGIESSLQAISQNGINSVLVEGGSKLISRLFQNKLVDEIVWISAPKILGNEHLSAIGELGISELSGHIKSELLISRSSGEDNIKHYRLTSLPFVT